MMTVFNAALLYNSQTLNVFSCLPACLSVCSAVCLSVCMLHTQYGSHIEDIPETNEEVLEKDLHYTSHVMELLQEEMVVITS